MYVKLLQHEYQRNLIGKSVGFSRMRKFERQVAFDSKPFYHFREGNSPWIWTMG